MGDCNMKVISVTFTFEILFTVLLQLFDRWSPYSYQNNVEKYEDDDEKREFNFKESLWFCMTSLTPQGGGEAPKVNSDQENNI